MSEYEVSETIGTPSGSVSTNLSDGAIVEGTVTQVEDERVLMDFGYKTDGMITRKDWSVLHFSSLRDQVAIGESVRAMIVNLGEEPKLSRKAAVDSEAWERFREECIAETILSVKIVSVVKGGLVGDLRGARAFLPASLVDIKYVGNLSTFQSQTISVIITEVDETEKKLIVSHRKVLEKQEMEARQERIHGFAIGQQVSGTVARLTPFGAFVDLGGVDGLLHVSEMSWNRVERPEEVVRVGDAVSVTVIRIEPHSGKISLSLKDADKSPWRQIARTLHPGDVVSGKVQRLSAFGAFVEVAPGVEGLVHVSQISEKRVAHPADVLQPGQTVQVKVLEIKPDEQRMSLSIREAAKQEEKRRTAQWVEKQAPDNAGTTLGELFGDLLRDKFK